jgi:hypothetical protein
LRLLALDGTLAKAEPKTLRPHPARRRPADPQRPAPAPEDFRYLALGPWFLGALMTSRRCLTAAALPVRSESLR